MTYLITVRGDDKSVASVKMTSALCTLGKDLSSDVKLSGWKISKQHAELFISNENIFIRDLNSSFGTYVNNTKISTYGPLNAQDKIKMGSFEISVEAHLKVNPSREPIAQPILPRVENNVIKITDLIRTDHHAKVPTLSDAIPASSIQNSVAAAHHLAAEKNVKTLLADENLKWRRLVHERLLESFDLKRTDVHRMNDVELREHTEASIKIILASIKEIPPSTDKNQLLEDVRDEAIGLGLLEPLLADSLITEIMVNRADEIFVERGGRLERHPSAFTSDRAVLGVIERIVAPIGRRIDESSPMVDARLKDGSRVNAVIAPLALKGPSLTIRKFSKRKLSSDDLLKFGSANQPMVEFLKIAVEQRKNIIISGGTGSGKTTLLNILSNFIPNEERIVTVEDAAELQLHHDNLVSMEARPANLEGKGQISIRDLVRNCLRMRPDRIVVGECRGGEALDMLQAMNTGHDGSLTTAHANTPRDMLARLEVMVLMAGMDLPVTAIREQVASAVDVVVQVSRFGCGARKITHITEITGVESGRIQMQDLFNFIQTGIDANHKTVGHYTGCGSTPEFYEKLAMLGVKVDLSIFDKLDSQGQQQASE
jgi:pilus assembly protein CpaF